MRGSATHHVVHPSIADDFLCDEENGPLPFSPALECHLRLGSPPHFMKDQLEYVRETANGSLAAVTQGLGNPLGEVLLKEGGTFWWGNEKVGRKNVPKYYLCVFLNGLMVGHWMAFLFSFFFSRFSTKHILFL